LFFSVLIPFALIEDAKLEQIDEKRKNVQPRILNIPEPIPVEAWRSSLSDLLKIDDMGLMNIFLAADGSIRWAADG
jgi:hypothetical protein